MDPDHFLNQSLFHPTGMALNYILETNFQPNVGLRSDSRKIGVLITDGKSQDEIVINSQNLRDSGIELYAIGEPVLSGQFQPLVTVG